MWEKGTDLFSFFWVPLQRQALRVLKRTVAGAVIGEFGVKSGDIIPKKRKQMVTELSPSFSPAKGGKLRGNQLHNLPASRVPKRSVA